MIRSILWNSQLWFNSAFFPAIPLFALKYAQKWKMRQYYWPEIFVARSRLIRLWFCRILYYMRLSFFFSTSRYVRLASFLLNYRHTTMCVLSTFELSHLHCMPFPEMEYQENWKYACKQWKYALIIYHLWTFYRHHSERIDMNAKNKSHFCLFAFDWTIMRC